MYNHHLPMFAVLCYAQFTDGETVVQNDKRTCLWSRNVYSADTRGQSSDSKSCSLVTFQTVYLRFHGDQGVAGELWGFGYSQGE